MIERSDDAREEDQVYSYLPTQRRVRRISPVERADRFLGSELNFDDFEGFSGRVLDYHWTYLGRRRVFVGVDAASPRVRYYGPRSRVPLDRWQLRDCLVVEQRSLDIFILSRHDLEAPNRTHTPASSEAKSDPPGRS